MIKPKSGVFFMHMTNYEFFVNFFDVRHISTALMVYLEQVNLK